MEPNQIQSREKYVDNLHKYVTLSRCKNVNFCDHVVFHQVNNPPKDFCDPCEGKFAKYQMRPYFLKFVQKTCACCHTPTDCIRCLSCIHYLCRSCFPKKYGIFPVENLQTQLDEWYYDDEYEEHEIDEIPNEILQEWIISAIENNQEDLYNDTVLPKSICGC